jgi:TPR repeat protein
VESHFHSLVESAYVERAAAALRGALARLYGSELAEPAAYLCGIAAIVACVLFGLGWPQPGVWPAATWSLGGGVVAWGVLEWRTRRRIAKRFESEFAQRVLGQLHANGSVKRWRMGIGLAAPLAVWLAMYGTADLAQAELVLSQWAHLGDPDLRLRTYPSRKMLDQKAEAGDARAQVILAWQLLLGASGATKDVEAAGRWLDMAQARVGQEPLWQAAKAVYVLNQDSMPDAIRGAAQGLGRAADRGLVEARYWEARIYLEERSPAFDAKRGLQTLARAADQNHAHAALSLGERLAAGQGTRRDVPAARRYLQRAAGAGLPEALESLGKLR